MGYTVKYSDNALKELKRLDHHQAKLIIAWIEKNLVDCENPRLYGKPLRYERKDEWRYRVGTYRIIAEIHDDVVLIEIINIGYRRRIYK